MARGDPSYHETTATGSVSSGSATSGCRNLSPKGWTDHSSGPDRQCDTGPGNPEYPYETLKTTMCDLTNGTASAGDVIRFGPKMFSEKIRFQ